LGLFLLLGCSEPEVVIPPLDIPTTGQNVLIEELTGVRCPNCPSAAARLESIKLLYGENIILVNIHGNLLTKPLTESKYDFRNIDASALEENFKPFIGKPSVIINRKVHPEFELMANPLQDQWQTIIEKELQLEQQLSLVASTEATDEGRILNIGIIPLVSLDGDYFLNVFLIENNIIDAQEDVDRIIPDYKHEHVLRRIITPFQGFQLAPLSTPDQVINNSITIMEADLDENWDTENLEFVVFVVNENNEVLQVILSGFDQ
jgi:hypothetical protein